MIKEETRRIYESRGLLTRVNTDAENKYYRNEKTKKDSWRDTSIFILDYYLRREIEEYYRSFSIYHKNYDESLYQECLDLINFAKMIAARIKLQNEKETMKNSSKRSRDFTKMKMSEIEYDEKCEYCGKKRTIRKRSYNFPSPKK